LLINFSKPLQQTNSEYANIPEHDEQEHIRVTENKYSLPYKQAYIQVSYPLIKSVVKLGIMIHVTSARLWPNVGAIDFCASTGWPAAWEEIISTSGDGNSSLLLSSRVINFSHIRYKQQRRHGTSSLNRISGPFGD
jgi:hypothetical protein